LATLLGPFVGLGGGLLGNYLFNYALSVSSTPNTVRGIQSAILAVFLVCVIIFVSGNFKTFNVKLVIIPVAVIGGFIGSILNRKCNEKAIKVTFTIVVSSVAALSLYNAVMSFI